MAPKFNVVCEPNELAKTTTEDSEELSETKLMQLEFWKGFSEYIDETGASFNSRKAFPQNWYSLSIGTSRAYISCTVLIAKTGRLACELYVPGRSQADEIFEALYEDKAEIEAHVGELDWQALPDRKACRIADYKEPVSFEDRALWPELFGWLTTRAEAFKDVFAQRVKDINLPEPQDGSDSSSSSSEDGVAKAVADGLDTSAT